MIHADGDAYVNGMSIFKINSDCRTAIGWMIELKALEFIIMSMEPCTKGNGLKTSSTAKEPKAGLMVQTTQASINLERKRDLEILNGQIMPFMKGTLKITISKDRVAIFGLMKENIKDSG